VKHAGPEALGAVAELLDAIRARDGLREQRPGIFYRKRKAWLHFHEDPAGLFADLRIATEWRRFPASRREQQRELLAAIDASLRG
jgi:hypothetical protein